MNLKDEYSKAFVEDLATKLSTKASSFNKSSFVTSIVNNEWEGKELKQRIRCITDHINSHLKFPYKKQINVLSDIAPNYSGLKAFVFPDFIEKFGLEDSETSFKAMELFTQLSTAEFAIRPFIEKHQKETLEQMIKWSLHDNHHLRRLASEGSRPRLPWASPLRNLINDPSPNLPILRNLKDDESEYVRKSVANHLNDISKDHSELVLHIANEWHGKSKERNRIVKHGLRTLLKRGDKRALAIFGLDNSKHINITNLSLSKNSIRIGDFIYFEFDVMNESNQHRDIRLEYRIDYQKANGSTSGKIFQLSEFTLKPEKFRSFKRKQWFRELSTRKHYPGEHRITLILNGDEKTSISLLING